jgi:hypothetical protein
MITTIFKCFGKYNRKLSFYYQLLILAKPLDVKDQQICQFWGVLILGVDERVQNFYFQYLAQ